MTDVFGALDQALAMGLIQPGEMWFGNPLFPRYLIGLHGAVLSLIKTPRILKPGRRGNYLGVTLRDLNGDLKSVYLHILVAEIARGPCPPGMECRHVDGNIDNCQGSNLVWGTHQENEGDKFRHGTNPAGERNGMAVLTESIVSALRERREATGDSYARIAADFGIAAMTAFRAITRRSWRETP